MIKHHRLADSLTRLELSVRHVVIVVVVGSGGSVVDAGSLLRPSRTLSSEYVMEEVDFRLELRIRGFRGENAFQST